MSWLIVFYSILVLYFLLILWLGLGLNILKHKELPIPEIKTTKFSIVIPMRNEAINLKALFQSISDLSYPKDLFEIILVDDASHDASWKLCREFQARFRNLQVYLLSNSTETNRSITRKRQFTPKKKAIFKAISRSSNPYILTTDADVVLPSHWLESYDAMLQATDADLVAGGVVVEKKSSFLSHYQHFDMLSLQLFGLGSFARENPVICNGANLCFKKNSYVDADVNYGKEQIASGDDVFTLQKFRELGYKIEFLSDVPSVVWTQPLETFEGVWQQRKRWAKKSTSVDSWYFKGVGLLVTLIQLSLVLSCVLGFWNSSFFGYLINAFVFKFLVDAWSLIRMKKLQNLGFCWMDFLKVSLVYPFFTLLFSLSSFYGKFEWKGREFSK